MADTIRFSAARPDDIAVVRHSFQRQLMTWQCDNVDDAVLVFSELVTNAVAHADGATEIVVERRARSVRVAVHDHRVGGVARDRSGDGPGGFGLPIVERLSSTWDCDPTDGGKVVWAVVIC